jgi:hypothetical protein
VEIQGISAVWRFAWRPPPDAPFAAKTGGGVAKKNIFLYIYAVVFDQGNILVWSDLMVKKVLIFVKAEAEMCGLSAK